MLAGVYFSRPARDPLRTLARPYHVTPRRISGLWGNSRPLGQTSILPRVTSLSLQAPPVGSASIGGFGFFRAAFVAFECAASRNKAWLRQCVRPRIGRNAVDAPRPQPKLVTPNLVTPMSQLGHSRRFDRTTATSGLPRRTDILRISGHVLKVPTTDSCAAANSIAIRSPLLRSKQSNERKGRLRFQCRSSRLCL